MTTNSYRNLFRLLGSMAILMANNVLPAKAGLHCMKCTSCDPNGQACCLDVSSGGYTGCSANQDHSCNVTSSSC